jgi:hypothetical protein
MSGLSDDQKVVLVVCLVGGLILTVIGIRFLLVPESAAFTFGVGVGSAGHELHYIIGLRDVWLGLLAMGLAVMREWRALGLWFGLCTVVCFVDAGIVATSSGAPAQVAFHVGSGIASIGLTAAILRIIRREA